MRCEHHPSVEATAKCGICEIPLCGVCSNYTANKILCDRCVNSVAMSDLFATRAKTTSKSTTGTKAAPGAASPRSASDMRQLLEEGKSINFDAATPQRKRNPRSRLWDNLQIAGIFGCFIFIGIQLSTNFGAGAPLTPAEIAAEERLLDQVQTCVLVFWEIAEILSNGGEPRDSLRCPESTLPNIVARVGNDIIVRHPSPQLLGYTDIFVSRSNPVPVLVQ